MEYNEPIHGIPRDLIVWLTSPAVIVSIAILAAVILPYITRGLRSCNKEQPHSVPTQTIEREK